MPSKRLSPEMSSAEHNVTSSYGVSCIAASRYLQMAQCKPCQQTGNMCLDSFSNASRVHIPLASNRDCSITGHHSAFIPLRTLYLAIRHGHHQSAFSVRLQRIQEQVSKIHFLAHGTGRPPIYPDDQPYGGIFSLPCLLPAFPSSSEPQIAAVSTLRIRVGPRLPTFTIAVSGSSSPSFSSGTFPDRPVSRYSFSFMLNLIADAVDGQIGGVLSCVDPTRRQSRNTALCWIPDAIMTPTSLSYIDQRIPFSVYSCIFSLSTQPFQDIASPRRRGDMLQH